MEACKPFYPREVLRIILAYLSSEELLKELEKVDVPEEVWLAAQPNDEILDYVTHCGILGYQSVYFDPDDWNPHDLDFIYKGLLVWDKLCWSWMHKLSSLCGFYLEWMREQHIKCEMEGWCFPLHTQFRTLTLCDNGRNYFHFEHLASKEISTLSLCRPKEATLLLRDLEEQQLAYVIEHDEVKVFVPCDVLLRFFVRKGYRITLHFTMEEDGTEGDFVLFKNWIAAQKSRWKPPPIALLSFILPLNTACQLSSPSHTVHAAFSCARQNQVGPCTFTIQNVAL